MPSTGRFLTRDAWDGNANTPMSFNRWAYSFSNPVKYTDPTGNSPCGPECIDIAREKILETIHPNKFTYSALSDCKNRLVNDYEFVGMFNISGYYTPVESDPFWSGTKIPIPADPNQHKYGKYLTKTGNYYNDNVNYAQKAKSDFLNNMTDSICMQGSGMLEDGRIITCYRDYPAFEWPLAGTGLARVKAFETVAVSSKGKLNQNDKIYINSPWFKEFMAEQNHDGILKVTDFGGGLATNTIDVYLGIGKDARLLWNDFNQRDANSNWPTIYWPVFRITKNRYPPRE